MEYLMVSLLLILLVGIGAINYQGIRKTADRLVEQCRADQ